MRVLMFGIITGIILMLLTFTVGMYALPVGKVADFLSDLEKLVYTIKWQSISIVMLLFGVQRVAGTLRKHAHAIYSNISRLKK